jgi:MFS family permease
MMLDVPGREALGGKAGPVLALLCLSPFVAVLDTTIMSIALPSIRDDLAFAASDVQWVLTAYSLSFGGLLLLAGRVGDSRGRKRVLVAG